MRKQLIKLTIVVREHGLYIYINVLCNIQVNFDEFWCQHVNILKIIHKHKIIQIV